MKNYLAFENAVKQRINEGTEEFEKTMDNIKGFIFAGIENARIYAYAKTGQWSKRHRTQAYHDAVSEFYTQVRGH